mmetsp:Transcript_110772/g.346537  ORF Transcript_110772/g.346537 Transcript_110772/m.346537 type:complete len:245 (+) Transcript_110772:292-1026(+)
MSWPQVYSEAVTFFPQGFSLWTADGTSLLPTGQLRFLQPALDTTPAAFQCVAIPRSTSAVAIVGVGIFPPTTAPAKREGIARLGYVISPWHHSSEPLPGMVALTKAHSQCCDHREVVAEVVPLSELGGEIGEADDLMHRPSPEPGTVVQVFEISDAGIMRTEVRETCDGNMVGGSLIIRPLPADASSSIARALLSSATYSLGRWARLANKRNDARSVFFDRLSGFSQQPEYSGLCICSADREEG